MVYDDSKRWPKEKASTSSPDYFRQDKESQRQKQVREATKDEKLARLKLQVQVEQQQKEAAEKKTGPAKEEQQEVMEAGEKTGSAKEFLERERKREEARQEAMKQGGPEAESEETS